jgi:predicted phosphoribosyltransferase
MAYFPNRAEAGRRLATDLHHYANRDDVVVLGLASGGVPVAFEVATELNAPLDVFLVRKLGVPGQEELAMGAIASGGIRVVNHEIVEELQIPQSLVDAVAEREQRELERRERAYGAGKWLSDVRHKTVILVDDGVATGASMQAALRALRLCQPARTVVGVPVAAPEICALFRDEVDEAICSITPEPFGAVGFWYDDFSQTTDGEIRRLLARAGRRNLRLRAA